MASKRPVAPDTPIRSFPTPNIDDLVVSVDVDSRLPGYKPLEYGTLHPDQTRFPGAKLVYQEPLDGTDSFVRRIYATDRFNQEAYNYAIKYSGGSDRHPIYVRSYVLPRADYQPLPDGSPDPSFPGAYLVEEEMAPVEGELNSLYVRVTRAFETLPGPLLTSFDTNEAGQKVTVTTQRKSSSGYALPAATATSSPSAQAEDTGVVTEQIRSVPSVFARQQFSAERPDPLPSKFRAAVPDVETAAIVAGTAQQPTLVVPQDLSASETQETQFLKRVSRRLRPDPDYPVIFTETTRTNTGQVATVTSVLRDSLQTADTGPLIESSEVTDLGDGRSIKVTTAVDQVFEQPSYTSVQEDLVPAKFRQPSETVIESTSAGTAALDLPQGALEHTEQQITLDTKRVRTRRRLQTTPVELTGGVAYTSELGGGYATIVEEYTQTPISGPVDGFGVVSDSVENTGDGFVRRRIVLPTDAFVLDEFDEAGNALTASTMAPLRGQDYDEELDLTIPYTQVVARPTTSKIVEGPRRRSTPRDKDHTLVVKYDIKDVQQTLDDYFWQIPDMVSIQLPDKLLKAYVVSEFSAGNAKGSGFGDTYFYTTKSNFSYRGKIAYDIEEGFSGNIPAVRHVFFLSKEQSQPQDVINKIRDKLGPNAVSGFLPNARPQAHELLVFGSSVDRDTSESVSFDSGSTSESSNASSNIDVTNIPATIHGDLVIGANVGSDGASLSVTPNTLPATQPYAQFPVGKWLYNINATPYKFSYVRIEATVVEITDEYV
jgi:hypothetical protein